MKITPFTFAIMLFSFPITAQTGLGLFENHIDIGDCENPGFAHYDSESQTYVIGGAGTNMWGTEDQFHYLWKTIQGDFILRAEIDFQGNGVDPHRKTGWIIKNDLDSNTEHINATTHGDGLTSIQYRRTIGGETEEIKSNSLNPDVIQIQRIGNKWIMSTAQFGQTFTYAELNDMEMDTELYVGLYVCSHNPEIVESVTFRNVRIILPEASDYTPYQDYIGSNLEVMDVSTGLRKLLYRSAHSIQAPNWSTDGSELIYNSKGRLFKYNLKTGNISNLNTGFATQNNNDHVLTQDGQTIGISHHSEEEDGASTLYYLPADGSKPPVQVTKPGVGQSYLHGWSPDNTKMVFTGSRDNQYDIVTVDVATGAETKLTNLPTLDDGPEYSPDGKYIFFNSVRTGKMKLWRMDADGRNPIQLTFDDYNDWFPHVSPDKQWIVYISFPSEIDPSSHPFYQHCLLQIMPYEGGESKVIGYLYGGQGTINVPSWSPDSKRIAFVSNSNF